VLVLWLGLAELGSTHRANGWWKSMDWFKGKSTGNHRFSHEIWGFPVKFPLNQSIEESNGLL